MARIFPDAHNGKTPLRNVTTARNRKIPKTLMLLAYRQYNNVCDAIAGLRVKSSLFSNIFYNQVAGRTYLAGKSTGTLIAALKKNLSHLSVQWK